LALFNKHFPNSRLHSELRRANSYTRPKLDGMMIWELLGKISADEILKNRKVMTKEPTVVEPSTEEQPVEEPTDGEPSTEEQPVEEPTVNPEELKSKKKASTKNSRK